jgi:PAS domain-containing protein
MCAILWAGWSAARRPRRGATCCSDLGRWTPRTPACGKHALPPATYPTGAWAIPPTESLIIPIAGRTAIRRRSLVLGLNPHRRDDEGLLDLATLVADRAAGAFAQARSVEEERRRSDRIWTNARDLMVVVDADGVYQSVSPAWTRILGHRIEDVIGRRIADFVVAEDDGGH